MKTKSQLTVIGATLSLGLLLAATPRAAITRAPEAEAAPAPRVQIALLLDTSSSMKGLIEQAKSQLWRIVNEFISAKQNGQSPDLQVALYEYGKSSLTKESGWIRQIVPLTNDLDRISEELFELQTGGGAEYCGWVIQDAVAELAWSDSSDDFKAIFIAGNEPFTQGPVDYKDSCKSAIERGIVVNTIHCGARSSGTSGQWDEGALLAEGKFMVIDHNRAVVHLKAPQDEEIARLGVELNKTYIAYGAAGEHNRLRQSRQDANVSALQPSAGASVQRALTKASANYCNDTWDLVDACQEGTVKLAEVKEDDLPAEMQKMSLKERAAHVQAKTSERKQLQEKIKGLNQDRARFLAERATNQPEANTLDAVIISAIREQAVKKNYKFD